MTTDINYKPVFKRNVEYMCVEYPGIIANERNMLSTLGGLEHIEKVFNDASKRLDLKFRPDDPSCKPLCGDRLATTSLLLRVCKYRRKKKKNDDCQEKSEEYKYQQSISGILTTTYKFSSLCDYQYISLRKNETTGGITNVAPFFCVDHAALKDDNFFTQNVPLFLPPPTFGRLDTPHDYRYKRGQINYRNNKNKTRKPSAAGEGVTSRKSRPNNCISVMYEDDVPTKCLPQALEVFEAALALVGDMKDKIMQGFEERPVWSRNALHSHFGCSLHFLKIILPVCAYYVVSGPWARLWIRLGYDPKLDPRSRIYQLIDFRLRQGIHSPHIPIKAKRGTFNYKLPHLSSKPHLSQAKSGSSFTKIDVQSTSTVTKEKDLPEAVYLYQPGILPAHRSIFYQACDILLPEAQELMEKSVSPDMKCTKEDGWFLPNTSSKMRTILTFDIYKTLSIMKGTTVEAPRDFNSSSASNIKDKELTKFKKIVSDDEIEERDSEDSEEISDEETNTTSQDDPLELTEIDGDDDDEFEPDDLGDDFYSDDELFDPESLLDSNADDLSKN